MDRMPLALFLTALAASFGCQRPEFTEPAPTSAPQWNLITPWNGTLSGEDNPVVTGTGLEHAEGSAVVLYADSACIRKLGESRVREGAVSLAATGLRQDGADREVLRFHVRILHGTENVPCLDTGLAYTLRPEVIASKARYFRLMFKDDASTSVVIGFHATSAKAADHKVHYGTEDLGQDAEGYPQSVAASYVHVYREMNNAFVHLRELRPDTEYFFVVSDPTGVSARYRFRTTPASPDSRLSIIAGGDSRNNRKPRQNANILVSKLRADFVMFGGDMTGGGSAREWREWFEDWQLSISPDGRITPLIVARGNHESSNEMIEKLFDTPAGVYYGVTAGGGLLRVYTLNSESGISGAQTRWLEADLAANAGIPWKFAQYHRPMRPHTSGKSDGTSQYQNWAHLFHSHRVQLVSESDAHTIKSTWPIRPATGAGSSQGFIRDDATGTVYIGEGCWGAPLRANNDNKPWTRDSGRFNGFNWIFLDRGALEFRFIRVDNAPSVGTVADSDRFRLPQNLDVWTPLNGAVVRLESDRGRAFVGREAAK